MNSLFLSARGSLAGVFRGRKGAARNSLFYIGAAGANAVIPFLLLPLLTRWLGPQDFGMVGTLMATINVAAILVGLSTHGLISVAYFRDGPESMPRQVGASIGVLLITGVPVLLLLLLLAPWIAASVGISARWLWVVWISACGQFVVVLTLAVWQARQQVVHYAVTQIGFTVIWACLSVLFIGGWGMGWEGRALGQAIASVIAIAVSLVVLTRRGFLDWNVRRWPVRGALGFGLPLLPHAFAAVVMSTVDRFALTRGAGPTTTGHYFAAVQMAALLTMAASALNQAWVPWMYSRLARADQSAKAELVGATYFIYALLLVGAAVMAVGAPTLVRLVAGPKFTGSAELLRYLAPAAAFIGMYYCATGYLFYAGRTGVLSAITVSAALLQIVMTFSLIGPFGARGVAMATLLSSFLYWLATAVVANRVMPMPWFGRLEGANE